MHVFNCSSEVVIESKSSCHGKYDSASNSESMIVKVTVIGIAILIVIVVVIEVSK